MSRQRPYVDRESDSKQMGEKYKKRLFVREGLVYEEVEARIIEPYTPPTPSINLAQLDVSGGPSHLHHSGIGTYKIAFSLLFPNRIRYVSYMANIANPHKFYDERGQIFTGVPEDVKPRVVEVDRRYVVDIVMVATKKDEYELKESHHFQDIEEHWAKEDIKEMANLGLLSVVTGEGEPVLQARPNDRITRGEYIAMMNRTRRLLESILGR